MLDHVSVPVSDYERSKRFYVAALSPLGYELIKEPSVSAAGFGRWASPTSGSARAARQAKVSVGPTRRDRREERPSVLPHCLRPRAVKVSLNRF